MQNGVHFISGLPRAGSTVLAALLRQNPRFHAGIISPVGSLFNAVLRQMSQDNETAYFLDHAARRRVLQGLFDSYYAEVHPHRMVFDSHRMWAAKMGALAEIYPAAKVICCVRHVPWIIDSLERLVMKNPLEASKIYNFDPSLTVFGRYEMVSGGAGLVGYAWNALRDAYFGPYNGNLVLLSYESLVSEPARAMDALYAFLGEPRFAHNFEDVAFSEAEFDARLGAPGLHDVRPVVRAEPRETILPPDLFKRVEKDSFWLSDELRKLVKVPVI